MTDAAVPAPVVAVLGTGTMGAGMVGSLVRAGIPVRMWNRDPAKARALAGPSAEACDSPADAVRGADVVLTMLIDADSVIDVIRRAEPAPGTIWLQCATVGIEGAERTIAVADELGLALVDAPVQGTKKPAEDGQLVVMASGPDETRDRLTPVFDAIGRKTLWLGPAGAGSRLKLVCNAWVSMLTAGVAQSVALARGLGVDPHDFLEVIDGGPLGAPYARVKGQYAIDGDYPVSFALSGAMKDNRLIGAALVSAGLSDRITVAILETMAAATARVDGSQVDMIAIIEGLPVAEA